MRAQRELVGEVRRATLNRQRLMIVLPFCNFRPRERSTSGADLWTKEGHDGDKIFVKFQ